MLMQASIQGNEDAILTLLNNGAAINSIVSTTYVCIVVDGKISTSVQCGNIMANILGNNF